MRVALFDLGVVDFVAVMSRTELEGCLPALLCRQDVTAGDAPV